MIVDLIHCVILRRSRLVWLLLLLLNFALMACGDNATGTGDSSSSVEGLSSGGSSAGSSSSQDPLGVRSGEEPKPEDFFSAGDEVYLDMVVRDFSIQHSDFENFAGRQPSSECQKDQPLIISEGNMQWAQMFTGNSTSLLDVGDTMVFGAGWDEDPTYWHYLTAEPSTIMWKEPIVISEQMWYGELGDELAYMDIERYPERRDRECYNDKAIQWYRDYPGVNFRSNQMLKLRRHELANGEKVLGFDSWDIGGFFPLDRIDGGDFGFGKQNVAAWCPPENLKQGFGDVSDYTLCAAYWFGMGDDGVSSIVADNPLARNYHFTTVVTFDFLHAPDQWLLVAADEYWVYVDGWLVADAGGDHQAPENWIDLNAWASVLEWGGNSAHTVHIFAAERQTDGSTFRLYTNIETFALPRGAEQEWPVYADDVPQYESSAESSSSVSSSSISSSSEIIIILPSSSSSTLSSSSSVPASIFQYDSIWIEADGSMAVFLPSGSVQKSMNIMPMDVEGGCTLSEQDSVWVGDCPSQIGQGWLMGYNFPGSGVYEAIGSLKVQMAQANSSNMMALAMGTSNGVDQQDFYANDALTEDWQTIEFLPSNDSQTWSEFAIMGIYDVSFAGETLPGGVTGDFMIGKIVIYPQDPSLN